MKKLLLSIIIVLFSLLPVQSQNANAVSNATQFTDWQLSNDGCWGCASFYWKITRTFQDDGSYRFDIWFCSNSFYQNGTKASTYVQGIYINVDGYYIRNESTWVLFKEVYSNQLTSFLTKNPYPKINMTWTGLSIY